MTRRRDHAFFLGGRDLEMETIRGLLEAEAPGRVHDRDLSWGARASSYRDEILAALERGETPVLIELEPDLEVDLNRAIWIDHHGPNAGRPTSLEQVFRLLELPTERWSRRLELVAANDHSGIDGLVEAGATGSEIRRVRAEDRAAQGITEAEEARAAESLGRLETAADGRLTIARLPHARTAALTDRLHTALGGPGYENLLVTSPNEVNFFGSGALAYALDRAFPGGWLGGDLPNRGFWGHSQAPPAEVRDVLEGLLTHDRAEVPSGVPR